MARLTGAKAEQLRDALLERIAQWPKDFQTAREWQESGFVEYSVAQVKRNLEILVRAKKVQANRNGSAVYYGAVES